jgi:hypothetical protein
MYIDQSNDNMVDFPNPFTKNPQKVTEQDLIDWYCTEVFPPLPDDRKGSAYRRMIVREFLNRRGNDEPRRLDEGTAYRSEDMSRLDRSINTVAEKFDRYENTVQSQSIWAVYHGENQKEQFLNDLLEIENLVLEHQNQR